MLKIFGRVKCPIIGMIHVQGLPGSPHCNRPMQEITSIACSEAQIYKDAEVDAVIVENMHDVPYLRGDAVGPEITACMSVICSHVKSVLNDIPVGVQILSGANKQALATALAADLQFIRAEGYIFAHVGTAGVMNGCAGELLRYRKMIGAENVQIFTDIKKKHSSHAITSDVDIVETGKAAEFFRSDGVVVSGAATGEITDVSEVKAVKKATKLPVLVGSGVNFDNVQDYMEADGLIIGSYFKHGGLWSNDVDKDKVTDFMKKVKSLREDH